MKEIKIWGIKLNPLTKNEIIAIVDTHVSEKRNTFHLTGVNPETIVQAQTEDELRASINSSNIVNIDNMFVLTSLRMLGYNIAERAACPDVFEKLLSLSNTKNYSVYFLGAKEAILIKMIEKLKLKYTNLRVVGSRNGYYSTEQEKGIVDEIRNLSPDMLFIAFPTPQKEVFINRYKSVLNTRLAFGVGGAFDVQAGKVNRAPAWMRAVGLEGLHRAVQDPANYGARYLKYYIPFIRLFLKLFLSRNRSSNIK